MIGKVIDLKTAMALRQIPHPLLLARERRRRGRSRQPPVRRREVNVWLVCSDGAVLKSLGNNFARAGIPLPADGTTSPSAFGSFWGEARTTAIGCGFNRWMQHTMT